MLTTTPTAAALFRAVLENPADDFARLVLADALEESGETERSEFIRLQCELARSSPPLERIVAASVECIERTERFDWPTRGPSPLVMPNVWEAISEAAPAPGTLATIVVAGMHGDELRLPRALIRSVTRQQRGNAIRFEPMPEEEGQGRIENLRRRERELEWQTALWGAELPFPAMPKNGHCTWRRGFVAAVACTAALWLEHGPAIVGSQPVERVTLSDRRYNGGPSTAIWSCCPAGQVNRLEWWIPEPIFRHLTGEVRPPQPAHNLFYDTPALAQADLSSAAVRWARAAAGLPVLTGSA